MEKKIVGVLVMAYGTPASLDNVEAYYTHIRRGNPPAPEKLQELLNRYEAIGGVSPLLEITKRQVEGIAERLKKVGDTVNITFKTYMGMKHAQPFIEETVKQMAEDGIKEAIGIVLAPHYSVMSVGTYIKTAQEAAEQAGIETFKFIKDYHLQPLLIEALVKRVEGALAKFPEENRDKVKVLFTAHSLPEKILEMGDPYPKQLRATAQAVADRAGIADWDFAWQSAGQTPVPWLGPDIMKVIVALKEQGVRSLLVCPVGFVSDHLEVLYDIDIECQKLAQAAHIHLERTVSLNDDPLFLDALVAAIQECLDKER